METQATASRIAVQNILLLTDFSPPSDAALRYAAAWARRLGATIHVAHFIRALRYSTSGDAFGMLIDRLWKDGRQGMEEIEAGGLLQGIPHSTYLDPGEIPEGVAAMLPAHQIDLVVMASTGRRGMEKLMMGSTAEAVFRSVPCPVLMLGPGSHPQLRPLEPRVILYATDFGPAAEKAAHYAFSLAQETQARLRLLTVLPASRGGAGSRIEADNAAAAQLRALIPAEAEAWCEPEIEVRAGRPAEEIVHAAAEQGADLLVLGARRPPRLPFYTGWATAYQVLGEAPCPVLTVRE